MASLCRKARERNFGETFRRPSNPCFFRFPCFSRFPIFLAFFCCAFLPFPRILGVPRREKPLLFCGKTLAFSKKAGLEGQGLRRNGRKMWRNISPIFVLQFPGKSETRRRGHWKRGNCIKLSEIDFQIRDNFAHPSSDVQNEIPAILAQIWRAICDKFAQRPLTERPLLGISGKSGRKKFQEKSSTNSTSHETKFFHRETLGSLGAQGFQCEKQEPSPS